MARVLPKKFIRPFQSCFEGLHLNLKLLRLRNQHRATKICNNSFTLISNNCTAGAVYEDLGLKYQSPFVGLYILPKDFLKLCSMLEYYLQLEVVEIHDPTLNFPVGLLGDVTIYFKHYDSFENAVKKWKRRKYRMNWDNLGFILVQRDGCSDGDMAAFDALDLPNKVILASQRITSLRSVFRLDFYRGQDEVGNILLFKNSFSGKRVMWDFDFVSWINAFKPKVK